jgi:hypothetical protein
MGLLRGVARTAVIAGTATAVSNNVSRRQQGRWAAQEQQQAAGQIPTQYAPQQYAPQQYAPPPEPAQYAPPEEEDLTEKLDRLAALRHRGQLTDEEYAAAKAKLLGL